MSAKEKRVHIWQTFDKDTEDKQTPPASTDNNKNILKENTSKNFKDMLTEKKGVRLLARGILSMDSLGIGTGKLGKMSLGGRGRLRTWKRMHPRSLLRVNPQEQVVSWPLPHGKAWPS